MTREFHNRVLQVMLLRVMKVIKHMSPDSREKKMFQEARPMYSLQEEQEEEETIKRNENSRRSR